MTQQLSKKPIQYIAMLLAVISIGACEAGASSTCEVGEIILGHTIKGTDGVLQGLMDKQFSTSTLDYGNTVNVPVTNKLDRKRYMTIKAALRTSDGDFKDTRRVEFMPLETRKVSFTFMEAKALADETNATASCR